MRRAESGRKPGSPTAANQEEIRHLKGTAGVIRDAILKPFQTFYDVEQVEFPFLIRLQQGRDEMPEVAFFPADGGAWRYEAQKRIREFLEKNLSEGIPII